jgi:polyphosphate kinase
MKHIRGLIPYSKLPRKTVKLPNRSTKDRYDDQATLVGRRFVERRY